MICVAMLWQALIGIKIMLAKHVLKAGIRQIVI